MLNAILHKGLGATDPYQQHILTDPNGLEYLLLSDGSKTWKIMPSDAGMSSRSGKKLGKPVADKLHEWLSRNYRHGLIDGSSEAEWNSAKGMFMIPVSTPSSGSVPRGGTGAYRSGSGSNLYYTRSGYYELVPDTNKTTAYTTALLNGKVITLTQVLKSVNPSTHVFYVPVGYYYQGDMSEAPSISKKDADDAGDRAGYNNNNNNNFFTPPPQSTSPKSVESDNTMMYLMLPLLAILAVKMLDGDNKRKKR